VRLLPALLFASTLQGCHAAPPEFVAEALREASKTCIDAGGKPVPAAQPELFALDVNDDSRSEFTFDLQHNITCEGAESVYSCGSLGCPVTLYEKLGGKWRPIAWIYAVAPESIQLGPESRAGYRDLLVADGAAERWHYEWQGDSYDRTHLEVRGVRVEFAGSVHGLREVRMNTDLLAAPERTAQVLSRVDKGTEVAIVGTAERGFFYVSPCNACESGFLHASELQP
jgi:hypothetical protein